MIAADLDCPARPHVHLIDGAPVAAFTTPNGHEPTAYCRWCGRVTALAYLDPLGRCRWCLPPVAGPALQLCTTNLTNKENLR